MILSIKSLAMVCVHTCTLTWPSTFSYRQLILTLHGTDYFLQSVPLPASETLLRHPSSCHKARRVHNLFLCWQVRRWIKSPMVSVEKHPHASLKYPGPTVMHLPPGDSELEPPLCQTCLSDHPFQRGMAPPEAESCSWESQRSSKVSRSSLPPNFVYTFHADNGSVLTRLCIPRRERGDSLKSETLLTEAVVHIWALLSTLNFDTHGQHEKQRVLR